MGEIVLGRLRAAIGDRYRVERAAEHGGMSTVFIGEDVKHGRRVAIKVLDPQIAILLGGDRFAREIEVAAQLQHPHIVVLLDSGAGGGLLWYVMPWVAGQSLRDRLAREGRLGVEETAGLGVQIAGALDYAHRQGVIHRDIKPENILLTDRQAMVTDFGIARAVGAAGGPSLTSTGVTLGTPAYMSPEQVTGERELDGRSDVYALGCVLYEMLAGQPPFTGPAETLGHQHLNVAPRPLAELRPGVPPALAAAIERALAKAPGDRFETAGEFAAALQGAVSTPSIAAAATPPARRPRRGVAIAIAAAAIAAVALAWRLGALSVLSPSRPAEAGERRWVWLSAFDGPTDDPTLGPASRDVVASALDQSVMLASVPQEQVRIALRNSGRSDTARVDEELARQLAYRSGVRVVVSGRISRLGGGYSIALRALDAEKGEVHLAPTATARDDRALIPTLTGLARELRAGLGERPEAMRARPGMFDVMTPSFEAFKLYVSGRRAINDNEQATAIPLLRQAIAVDPDFAAAWGGLGTAMANLGMSDSALAAHHEALRHHERLSEAMRLDILAKVDGLEGRPEKALERYDAIIALDPTPVDAAVALNNKAGGLLSAGRYEEALALYRRSAKAWPVEVPVITQSSIASTLIALGRWDEAATQAALIKGPFGAVMALELAMNLRQWDRGDSIAVAIVSQPELNVFYRVFASMAHASALGVRGRMNRARVVWDGIDAMLTGPFEMWAPYMWWGHVELDMVAGRIPDFARGARGPGVGDMAEALSAAWAGDSLSARRSLRRAAEGPFGPELGFLVEAWLDRSRRRWDAVIGRLAPEARIGVYDPGSERETMRKTYRWLVAEAFAQSGRPDSATTYLALMLEPPGRSAHLIITRGLTEPYVRARLVRLLAGSGRVDEARREWEVLANTVTQPDPEVVAVLDETRAVLQSVGAMSASGR